MSCVSVCRELGGAKKDTFRFGGRGGVFCSDFYLIEAAGEVFPFKIFSLWTGFGGHFFSSLLFIIVCPRVFLFLFFFAPANSNMANSCSLVVYNVQNPSGSPPAGFRQYFYGLIGSVFFLDLRRDCQRRSRCPAPVPQREEYISFLVIPRG